jgi:flavodoxin
MSKSLVAYFSASGTTARVAKNLASAIGADLFEIVPETAYTSADLNWQNKQSRSSIEMSDRSSRPAVGSHVPNMDDYDTIFVGFPIWWYREPSIIDTFLEMYDFSDKKLVPFATSGGSGIGECASNFSKLAPNATVVEGKRLTSSASKAELASWAENI